MFDVDAATSSPGVAPEHPTSTTAPMNGVEAALMALMKGFMDLSSERRTARRIRSIRAAGRPIVARGRHSELEQTRGCYS